MVYDFAVITVLMQNFLLSKWSLVNLLLNKVIIMEHTYIKCSVIKHWSCLSNSNGVILKFCRLGHFTWAEGAWQSSWVWWLPVRHIEMQLLCNKHQSHILSLWFLWKPCCPNLDFFLNVSCKSGFFSTKSWSFSFLG